MQHDDADGTDDRGGRDDDFVCRTGDAIGGGRGHVVDKRRDGFGLANRTDQTRQTCHAGGFTAGRGDVEQDRPYLRVLPCRPQLCREPLVTGDAADKADIIDQHSSLLHVAATRAKRSLRVSWSGKPTSLIPAQKESRT